MLESQNKHQGCELFISIHGVKEGCVLAPTLLGILFSTLLSYVVHGNDGGVYLHTRSARRLFNLTRLWAKTKVWAVTFREALFAALVTGACWPVSPSMWWIWPDHHPQEDWSNYLKQLWHKELTPHHPTALGTTTWTSWIVSSILAPPYLPTCHWGLISYAYPGMHIW